MDYAHDDRDQLIGADYDYQADESYTYDENGNRTNTGYATGGNNQLLSDGVFDYEYDQEGNRTRRVTIATGATTVYTWDHRNRLTSVTEYASEADADLEQNALKTVEHTYDAFNQWTSRTVDPDGDAGTAALEKTFFLYDQGQIALQLDKTGSGDATASDLSHRYLWSDAVDQLLADENAAGEILWPLTDHLGTVRDLAEYDDVTDTTAIVNHRAYDAFGNLASETNAAVDSLFGYTGRPLDEATGLQNNLHRWYDAHAGRWVSEDPIGFEATDSNLRRYVANSPNNSADPSGLAPWHKLVRGVKIDHDTAEYVLKNGKRIKIRNYQFINSDVCLDDIEAFTNVSAERIKRLRSKYKDGVSIKYDAAGQPDFSSFGKAKVAIKNVESQDYANQAWRKLKDTNPKLYSELYKNSDKYHWHHTKDGQFLLIDKDIHVAFQHTGLKSMLESVDVRGAAVCLIPGLGKFLEGKISDGGREIFVEATPLGWSVAGAEILGEAFDNMMEQAYEKPKRKFFP